MKAIRKLKVMLLLALLGWAGTMEAVNVFWDPVNGNNNNTGLSASKPLKTWTAARNLWAEKNPDGGGWVYMMSTREITTGDGTFNGSTSSGNMRIRRHSSFTGPMFVCPDGTHLRFSNMLIDGGTTYNTTYNAASGYNSEGPTGCMIEAFGQVTIQNCTLQRGNGRCIYAHNDGTTKRNFVLTDVLIRAFKEGAGSAIFFRSGDWHNATLTRVEISGCYAVDDSYGGTIRENGGTKTNLTVVDCNIHDNTAKCGGGIYWNAGGHADAKLVVKGNTKIYNNTATLNGGGIYCEARMDVQGNVQIYNNNAQYGGGIYFRSYFGGDANYDGQGFNVKVTDNVKIYNNSATRYGGGMCLRILNSPDVGFTANHTAISTTYSLTVDSNGAIYQNHAPQGGGVAILDLASKFFRGREADGTGLSKEIKRNVSIAGGSIHDNYTESATLTAQKGGGIFIRKYEGANNDDATDGEANPIPTGGYSALGGAGTMTVTASGGTIYNNVVNNGHGGGIHIVNEFYGTSISSTCKVEVRDVAEIYKNTANGNGGGVYINGGNFVMNGGTIGKSGNPNTAQAGNGGGLAVANGNITINNGNIDYNKAVYGTNPSGNNAGGYGGAFYLTGGTATVQGGSVSRNNADKNGGGFYVNVSSDSDITTIKGGANVGYNTAVNGAGAFINKGQLVIQDAATTINHNTASTKGGGLYMNTGTVSIANAQVLNNTATSDGGGLFVSAGNVTITGTAHINGNQARDGGGGYVNNGTLTLTGSGAGMQVNSNVATYSSTSYGNGGGFYVGGGNVSISGICQVDGNTASDDGGGFYTTGGTVTISGANAVISHNSAAYWGGGIRAGGDVTLTGGQILGNHANARGGGVYVHGGNFTMSNGTIGGTTTQGNYTENAGSSGGGVYVNAGTANLTGGSISGNYSNVGYGGGIYMYGGTCTLSNGATIGGTSSDYANSAKFGGGIYSAGGTITVKGGKIQYNEATTAGGGIYTNGADGVVNMEKQTTKAEMLSYIEYNSAEEGGGIYANRGVVNFSDGYIQYNYADNAGGGIYVNDNGEDDYGHLFLKGSAQLIRNHVPTGKKGGGVYLKGVITVGEQVSNPADLGTITAKDNFAYTTTTPDTYVITDETRNNVYLPVPVVDHQYHKDVITVIYNGISTASEVGFSVPSNYVPVIYCANNGLPCTETGYEDYTTSQYFLHQFSTGMELQNNLFDDTHHYVAVHYVNQPLIFDPDHVYLYGFWTNIVITDPTDGHYEEHLDDIDTPEKLAYFISYVNGINDCEGHPHPDAVGNITADIDMSQYGWVPIGELTDGFQGTLNGNGHTITGITSLVYGDHMAYGIVGQLNGGQVKDLFVKDAVFGLEYKDGLIVGGLVGDATNGGTVENSEVSCTILAMHPNTIMGGLVGRMGHGTTEAPTVHSSIAIADMTGCEMGGLVGRLEKGNLYNSFCNPRFTLLETSEDISDKYIGGLVAVNRGTVENCYPRQPRGTVPTHNFGIFVGDNTGGTVSYCYAPTGMTTYKKVGNNPTGHGNYTDTDLPYLYSHRDTQVDATNDYVPTGTNADKQMMIVLNNWVDDNSDATVTYTKWGRPWQVSNTLKPINEDFPVLRMPLANAMASSKDDPYIDYNDIDFLLDNYEAANDAIWMYNSDDDVQGDNSASAAKLYIDQDVALINANPLKAYVSVTLDNSAGAQGMNPTYFPDVTDETDWHMIATSLSDAPIGINYTDGETPYEFDYGHPDGMPYYRFYLKDDPKHGYFPSHRYGETYTTDNGSPTVGGNYYSEWDFYSYYEPEYHWINFKRNSASHHHFDFVDHDAIVYTNEAQMIPGKGYFAATREETLLQCYGTLNYDEVDYEATMSAGLPRHGYNLLGNPYQAYLNFDAFADANSDDTDAIWDDVTTASYTILDEDEPETGSTVETILGNKPVYYRTYAYGCSSNPGVNADGFIHPHQGFFVKLQDREAASVYFYPEQRDATVTGKFRSAREKVDYPLVNLFAMEDNGNADVVTIELGRPEKGGALLMQSLRTGNGKIWCHYDDKDYTIAFTQPGVTEVPIRFETLEDTEYTLTWNTLHGDFGYMHLIDNKTGADIDCLTTDQYRFSAKKSDYTSRFKLVFDYTGVDENGSSTGSETFAFVMGDDIVVTGEGMLQVFDVTGRLVMSRELDGVQSSVPLYNMSNGVYVLRLTNGKQSQVQKMVISK